MSWNFPKNVHIHKLDRNSSCACGFVLETAARQIANSTPTPVDRRQCYLTLAVLSRSQPIVERELAVVGVQSVIECLEQVIRELKLVLPRS